MKTLSAILVGTALLFSTAEAEEVGGILLPESRGGLSLNGAGLLRKGFVFKIYVGALYIADPDHADRILTDVPKRIDIHYFHHTPKKHMVRAAEKTLRLNLPPETYEALLPRIQQLHEAFLNGKKGAYASILHEPGRGLTYQFNGRTVITISGDDFANAYFAIWLGARPSSRTMKAAMLNKE